MKDSGNAKNGHNHQSYAFQGKKTVNRENRTLNLISSQMMLKLSQKCINTTAEKPLDEEQAGFRPRKSTDEQIFNYYIPI